jgi:hypothetical protein
MNQYTIEVIRHTIYEVVVNAVNAEEAKDFATLNYEGGFCVDSYTYDAKVVEENEVEE